MSYHSNASARGSVTHHSAAVDIGAQGAQQLGRHLRLLRLQLRHRLVPRFLCVKNRKARQCTVMSETTKQTGTRSFCGNIEMHASFFTILFLLGMLALKHQLRIRMVLNT